MIRVYLTVFLGLLAATWDSTAAAYIDPATGSLVIQGLIAAFVGASFALKNFYYTKVKRFFDFLRGRKPDVPAQASLQDPPPPTA